MTERFEVSRTIPAEPSAIFRVLSDPQGHVAIDSSGMLQSATGERATKVGDSFVVHMDRESLNDMPMGKYDVQVTIEAFEPDREIAWGIGGIGTPRIGHIYGYRLEPSSEGTVVTQYYDWSNIEESWKPRFPVLQEGALRATLGILDRTVQRGYPLASA
jgi:Polyketide cyclase / dehydrase and lipid transport